MNREIYQPLTIGAIIIWVLMNRSLNIPIIPLIILISLSYTIYNLYRSNVAKYLIIISLSVLIGTIGIIRIEVSKGNKIIPIDKRSIISADLYVIKDSIPVTGGFLSIGRLCGLNSNQLKVTAQDNIIIFSNYELLSGLLIKNVKIKWKDGVGSTNLKEDFFNYSSSYYLIRSKIINFMKIRTGSPLLMALLTGNKTGLELYQIDLFRKTGCSHILALSGFHVGIITIMLLLLFRLIITGSNVYMVCVIALILYLIIVGITPSLVRSVLMFFIGAVIKIRGYKISIFNILIISFYIIVIIIPEEFYTLSFQLSFLALFGILTIGGEINSLPLIKGLPNLLKLPISASLSAMISTSWIIFPLFGVLYPIGILTSIILTPIITIYIWIGIITLLIPPLCFVTEFLEKMIYILLNFFSKSPVLENSGINSSFVTLIMIIIPVILVLLKIHRRTDAGRFNIKFKL